MDDGGIAGVEPAVANSAVGGLRVVEVALHHHVALYHNLTQGLAVVGNLAVLVVHY